MIVGDRGPLASFGAGLAEELAGVGYTPACIARHVRLLRRVDQWMAGEGLTAGELTATEVERFVRAGRAGRAAVGLGWPSHRGVAPLLAYLRRSGVVPTPTEPVPAEPVERVAAAYRRYLVDRRALAASTVEDYERYARVFFSQLAPPVRADLTRLSAAEVTAAVRCQCRSRSVGWAKNFNTVLRSLLRFLFLDGYVPRDLSVSALSVAGYRHGRLPKALDPDDVARLLATCAGQRRARRRDLAILTVVVRLGLRAGEVAAMRVADVDWRAGEILVRGKGDRQDRLPLPVDVGAALVNYVQRGRAGDAGPGMFARVIAPRGPLRPTGVEAVVHDACVRCGMVPVGAHRLRHTAATGMQMGRVARGASFGRSCEHALSWTCGFYGVPVAARGWRRHAR